MGAVMNDAAWWARVVQARTERDDLRPQRVWALHKGERAAAIDLKAVPGVRRCCYHRAKSPEANGKVDASQVQFPLPLRRRGSNLRPFRRPQ